MRDNRVNIPIQGGKRKMVPYGLGNFGQPNNFYVMKNQPQEQKDSENSGNFSRVEEDER